MSLSIFDRARQLVAQSPHPTTLREQLSRLAKRRKRTRITITPDPLVTLEPEGRRYPWQERADLQ